MENCLTNLEHKVASNCCQAILLQSIYKTNKKREQGITKVLFMTLCFTYSLLEVPIALSFEFLLKIVCLFRLINRAGKGKKM